MTGPTREEIERWCQFLRDQQQVLAEAGLPDAATTLDQIFGALATYPFPPDDEEREILANDLERLAEADGVHDVGAMMALRRPHFDGGTSPGDDLRRAATLLRQPPPPPAAGVSKARVLEIIRGRYDGMTREDWDVVIAAVEALPEPEPPPPAAGVSKAAVGDEAELFVEAVKKVFPYDHPGWDVVLEASDKFLADIEALPEAAPRPTFQARVDPWLLECFGEEIARDKVERNHRFLEESLELAQSCGCIEEDARALVDYVYGRPKGDAFQEVGGVLITLAALCLAHGFDMHAAGEEELARIWGAIGKIRAKQAAKPKGSPLPQAVAAPPSGVDREADGWRYLPELPPDGPAREFWCWSNGFPGTLSPEIRGYASAAIDAARWAAAGIYSWKPTGEPPPLPEAKA